VVHTVGHHQSEGDDGEVVGGGEIPHRGDDRVLRRGRGKRSDRVRSAPPLPTFWTITSTYGTGCSIWLRRPGGPSLEGAAVLGWAANGAVWLSEL
jgi:hypothetical protein